MDSSSENLGQRVVAISGDLGSGKSSVAKVLAQLLGVELVSTGDIHRSIADRMRVSTLELNRIAEQDARIDDRVDDTLRDLANSSRPLVVDSRMAWWFVPDAFSVHLTASLEVGARRILARTAQAVEAVEEYSSEAEALMKIRARAASERRRFRSLYEVDTSRLRNYDVVIDTTTATVGQVVDDIVHTYYATAGELNARPRCLVLSPSTIYPSQPIQGLRNLWDDDTIEILSFLRLNPLSVGFRYPYYFVVDGHRRLSAAIHRGRDRVPAVLLAEGDEGVVAGMSARQYFGNEVTPTRIYDWEDANRIALPVPSNEAE